MSGQSSRIVQTFALLQMGRFKFLAYSPILYGIGAVAGASASGQLAVGRYFFGLIAVWVTHAMTHYCNEYFDFMADSANKNGTAFTGGSRVLVNGLLPRWTALAMAMVLTLVSLGVFYFLPNLAAQVIGLCAIALAWAYSAPPIRLAGRGLGELTVVLVLNVLTPIMGCVMQSGRFEASLFASLLPLCLIGYVRMLVMSIPDREGDAATNKRTFIVRFGLDYGIKVHTIGMIAAYASILPLLGVGLPPAVAVGLLCTAPFAAWHAYRVALVSVQKADEYKALPFWASTHNATAALSVLIGMTRNKLTDPRTVVLALFPLILYSTLFCGLLYLQRRSAAAPANQR